MKKILLIGKTGQLGSNLMKDASSFGFEIFGFKKKEMDVTNEIQVREKIEETKPDILINTAAYLDVYKCEANSLEAARINFLAVQNLAELCKDRKIVFVTYSTNYVFDGRKKTPYIESDHPYPLQIYGVSKLAGEYAALSIYPKGTFIIRTSGLYGGQKGSPEKGNFVLNILRESRDKRTIKVSSEQIVSTTYAPSLSRSSLKLLKNQAEPGIYHLINEGYCSWYEFAKEIFTLMNVSMKIIPVNRGGKSGNVKRPKFSALENTRAKFLGVVLPSWQNDLGLYCDFLKSL